MLACHVWSRLLCAFASSPRHLFVCVWGTYFCPRVSLRSFMPPRNPQSALESELRELRGRLADMEQSSGSREDDLQREIASLRDKWQSAEVGVCAPLTPTHSCSPSAALMWSLCGVPRGRVLRMCGRQLAKQTKCVRKLRS
jgi:hypothetical protein